MDYRKTIKLYEEDGTTVMCDFDIVLNRSMAVAALKGYPVLVDVLFNGVGFDVEDGEPSEVIMKLIDEGKADRLFVLSEDMPDMLKNLFSKMLDAGEIRTGDRDYIVDICGALITDDEEGKFLKDITGFFMMALRQSGKEKLNRKLPKFTMN
jgi:hypothetical protein